MVLRSGFGFRTGFARDRGSREQAVSRGHIPPGWATDCYLVVCLVVGVNEALGVVLVIQSCWSFSGAGVASASGAYVRTVA